MGASKKKAIVPKIFVSMSFAKVYEKTYETIKSLEKVFEVNITRFDKDPKNTDLAKHLKKAIEGSDLLIADISSSNGNVLDEAGIAKGKDIPVIYLSSTGAKTLPSNLKHKIAILYKKNRKGYVQLKKELRQRIETILKVSAEPTTIAIASSKGGSAKSTTAIHLAVGLAKRDQNVLLVDFDPQASLTSYFFPNKAKIKTVIDFLDYKTAKNALKSCFMNTEIDNLTVLGNDPDVYDEEPRVKADSFRMRIEEVHQLLMDSNQRPFDYVIYDTPAGRGNMLSVALELSQHVIIPTDISPTSIKPLQKYIEYIQEFTKKRSLDTNILGVLISMYHKKYDNIAVEYRKVFKKTKVKPFSSQIDFNPKIVEAIYNREILKRNNAMTKQINAFIDSVLERIEAI